MARRPTNRGLVLLRRSGDRQETSLDKQLTWAVGSAAREGVVLDAAVADISHMQARGLHTYKGIRLDDAIPGDELERPGLSALIKDVEHDRTISHVLAFARDRMGRPQSPVDCIAIELRLLRAGVRIVYSDQVLDLPASGQFDIGEIFKGVLEYYMSGEQPRKLAEQMICTQRTLVRQNRVVGGNPPYGCVRALIDSMNQILEVVPKGKRVRQSGCHTVWIPDPAHPERLATWVTMLTLKEQGWGYKRIANYLNDVLKVPSPNAGQQRRNHGRLEVIEGRWSTATVKSLLENRTILAIFDYGRRSEGKHRRLGPDGWRFLTDSDRNAITGRPKVIQNDSSLVTSIPLPFEPKFDPARWTAIQKVTQERGKSQRGIPRATDPARYPLTCCIFDLSDRCNSVMYGRTSGRRALYTCGRYLKYGRGACENNQLDAEALLQFTLGTLVEMVDRLGALSVLRAKLLERARREEGRPDEGLHARRAELEGRVRGLEQRTRQAAKNFAFAEDADLRTLAEEAFADAKRELDRAKSELALLARADNPRLSPEDEVDEALGLLSNLQRLSSDHEARGELHRLFKTLGLKIGLRFVGALKGTRPVRRLAAGIIVMGREQLPGITSATGVVENERNDPADVEPPLSAARSTKRPGEGVSSTMGNRGDKI